MPATAYPTSADPALCAVRVQRRVIAQAEVDLLVYVVQWAVEHETDEDRHAEIYGGRPLCLGGVGSPRVDECDALELAAALGKSTDAGLVYLGTVMELRYRLPLLWRNVLACETPVWKALDVAANTKQLPIEGATYVDGRLADAIGTVSGTKIRRLVEEALIRFDPEQAAAEAAAAKEARCFKLDKRNLGHRGTVEVYGTLDTADALDVEKAVELVAKQLADHGCTDSLDVRRSKALGEMARTTLGLSTGDGATGRGVTLYAHLSNDSMTTGGVARCANTGTITLVEQIKAWCTQAGTKVTIKPVIDLADRIHTDAYEVTDRLDQQASLRDVHCVFPHCNHPARRCDNDHCHAYDDGGPTATENLAPLCRRHHRCKTFSTWTYNITTPGRYVWTSPSMLTFLRDHHGTTDTQPDPRHT